MEKYLQQLLADIARAAQHVDWPYPDRPLELHEWISDDEEDKTAPRRQLEDWTGIRQEQLPPAKMLDDAQVHELLEALKEMLKEYNWMFCLVISAPERVEYEVLRANFRQEAIIKRWHIGLFSICPPNTPLDTCLMGEHCQCRFFDEMSANWIEEDLTPEEERARELQWEIQYLKKKHGDRWMRYYPYHLDPDYDDENGNPHDYGFGSLEDDDEEWEDDWWRR